MAVSLREVISFGRYEPLFRVAAGGMAEVYAARIQGEAGFQKLVAVKRMLPHLANEPGFIDMFLNEAKLAAYVASPHVVQTLDLGRGNDGSLYIVMELVVGLSLAKLAETHPGPLPIPIALELLAQAAQGLDDAHEATTPAGDPLGLIHRDVSPHNVLVGVDGRARVTDFGIARAVNRPRAETNIRELKGKFAYMSPEQTRLHPLDRRSDLFSLGIIAWETLTGARLFAHRDPIESVRLVQAMPIAPPSARRPEVPAAVDEVVLRALERDRGQRYPSAGELALALRRAARASFGEPPHKKEISAFVERSGGEELQRLQRLIRLGTEGAAAEAIEAVQPGITRVLPEDASGIAPVGTGAKRTAVLESEEVELGPPTVMLPTDDLEPAAPLASEDTRTNELRSPERTQTATDPPRARSEQSLTSQVTKLAVAAPPARGQTLWFVLAAIVFSLSLGAGLALVFVWPSEPRATVLPVTPEEAGPLPPPIPTPVPVAGPVAHEPVAHEPVAHEPVAHEPVAPVPRAPVPSAPVAPAAIVPTVESAPAIEPERAEPRAPERPRRGRRRRTAQSRPAQQSTSSAPATSARPTTNAPLLDVQDFDRRPR